MDSMQWSSLTQIRVNEYTNAERNRGADVNWIHALPLWSLDLYVRFVIQGRSFIARERGEVEWLRTFLDFSRWASQDSEHRDRSNGRLSKLQAEHCLTEACFRDNYPVLQLFLDHGASVQSPYNYGSCHNYSTEMLNLLIAHGFDINGADGLLIRYSVDRGDYERTKWLLEHGADPNAEDPGAQSRKQPVIRTALGLSEDDIFFLLLDFGAQIGTPSRSLGLIYAAIMYRQESFAIYDFLCRCDTTDKSLRIPCLMEAFIADNVTAVRAILQRERRIPQKKHPRLEAFEIYRKRMDDEPVDESRATRRMNIIYMLIQHYEDGYWGHELQGQDLYAFKVCKERLASAKSWPE